SVTSTSACMLPTTTPSLRSYACAPLSHGERTLGGRPVVQHFDRIARVVDVAECVRAEAVAHEALNAFGKRARSLERHRQGLVLLLAQPPERVVDVDSGAYRVAAIGAATVHASAEVHDDRTAGHFCRLAVVECEVHACGPMAVGHDASRAVRLVEVGDGPD